MKEKVSFPNITIIDSNINLDLGPYNKSYVVGDLLKGLSLAVMFGGLCFNSNEWAFVRLTATMLVVKTDKRLAAKLLQLLLYCCTDFTTLLFTSPAIFK